jgi:flagellar hook-associated protein 1 FlgK
VSALSSLNAANSALMAQQRALDITGQNVANVNTDGYSRQRVDLQSIGASTVPALFSTSSDVGGGVSGNSVTRIRDAFMENRALAEHATSAQLTVQADAHTQIEASFREPGDNGLQAVMDTMWSSFEDVTSTDEAARSTVLENIATVANSLNTTSAALDQQWTQTREDLSAALGQANATAAQIADLNSQIQAATQGGGSANELSDKRDALVLSLATSIGATASTRSDGMVDVLVGGSTLVSGARAISLALDGAASLGDLSDGLAVKTVPGGTRVAAGGTAGGQLAVLSDIIPTYQKSLDDIAVRVADVLNSGNQGGYRADGSAGAALLGSSDPTKGITAGTITLLTSTPADVAASAVAGVASTDTSNAQLMARLGDTSGVDASYRTLVTQLGVASSVATQSLSIQSTITSNVDAARQSVSGVSIDEEMTQMLAFQHGYEAAARMITAMDEVLDKLINSTGRVGL